MSFLTPDTVSVRADAGYEIVIAANAMNFNLRDAVDALGYDGRSPATVICVIRPGVIIGSTTTANPAFTTGVWPDGSRLHLELNRGSRVQGRGGDGGRSGRHHVQPGQVFGPGHGGPALAVTAPLVITNPGGEHGHIWGGGGGGGGGGLQWNSHHIQYGGGGGGGYGGSRGAPGGAYHGSFRSSAGEDGTLAGFGRGGSGRSGSGRGGNGGGPGEAGQSGSRASGSNIGHNWAGVQGGAAGVSINGVSLVTFVGERPLIRGRTEN